MNKQILKRIQSPYPIKNAIVNHSTPVLSFGDFLNAEVFTLGINPSNLEFLNRKGDLLKNNLRRLQTLSSLNASDCTSLSQDQSKQVLNGCVNYFNRRPYNWFDKFSPILSAIGYSFNSLPLAAHVDLVQWATKDKWGKLSGAEKKLLIDEGREFLEYQLESEKLHTILLNGRTVINEFHDWSKVELKYSPLDIPKDISYCGSTSEKRQHSTSCCSTTRNQAGAKKEFLARDQCEKA
jgi:hypothetical protein